MPAKQRLRALKGGSGTSARGPRPPGPVAACGNGPNDAEDWTARGPAGPAGAGGAGETGPAARMAVVVCAGGIDAASLAKHLAGTSGGDASVTLVSVDRFIAEGSGGRAPIDYAATSARIWSHLGRRDGTPAGQPGGACINASPGCEDSCNLPVVDAEATVSRPDELAARPHAPTPDVRFRRSNEAPLIARAAMSAPITVLVASDRPAVLARLLPHVTSQREFRVLGEAVADPTLLHSALQVHRPGVLLLDRALLDRAGGTVLPAIRAKAPDVRVLLLADSMDEQAVGEILRNRLDGFLLAACPPDACVKSIRAVSRGELWLPRALLAKAVADLLQSTERTDLAAEQARSPADATGTLTRREREIVDLLRRGFTNKEIARDLGVMEDTVKKHLQSVFGKLGVRRRALVVLRQIAGQSRLVRGAHDFPL